MKSGGQERNHLRHHPLLRPARALMQDVTRWKRLAARSLCICACFFSFVLLFVLFSNGPGGCTSPEPPTAFLEPSTLVGRDSCACSAVLRKQSRSLRASSLPPCLPPFQSAGLLSPITETSLPDLPPWLVPQTADFIFHGRKQQLPGPGQL